MPTRAVLTTKLQLNQYSTVQYNTTTAENEVATHIEMSALATGELASPLPT
jgi:hypothetical protein